VKENKMKFFVNENYIDFEAPIQMDEDQFNKFIDFMKDLLEGNVEVNNIPEKHKEIGDVQRESRNWTSEEFFLLLSPLSNEELQKKLNRSNMSVVMMRGNFVPEFMSWARKKGYDSERITETVVKQFMEEEGK
tara:strand:+ start:2085 stop:2483 length:399 start_codon:yes stop_codon:yes gene_type:complete